MPLVKGDVSISVVFRNNMNVCHNVLLDNTSGTERCRRSVMFLPNTYCYGLHHSLRLRRVMDGAQPVAGVALEQ